MKVRATRFGVYRSVVIKPGRELTLAKPAHFDPTWMERVTEQPVLEIVSDPALAEKVSADEDSNEQPHGDETDGDETSARTSRKRKGG